MAVSGSSKPLMLSSASPGIAPERARPEQARTHISYVWLSWSPIYVVELVFIGFGEGNIEVFDMHNDL
jgi:hypothetical protein